MKRLFFVLLINFVFNNNLIAAEDDYAIICQIYKNSIDSPELINLSRTERLKIINLKIWTDIKSNEAKEIMSIVATAAPDIKYKLFRESVEIATGEKWDCPAMRDY